MYELSTFPSNLLFDQREVAILKCDQKVTIMESLSRISWTDTDANFTLKANFIIKSLYDDLYSL